MTVRRQCSRCGLTWLERPVQTPLPDAVKTIGREHQCPPALPRDVAERLRAAGVRVSPRMHARIRLGLTA